MENQYQKCKAKDCLSIEFKNPINPHLSLLIAEAFSQHFSTIGSSLSGYSHSGLTSTQNGCGIFFCFRTISETDIQRVIDGLSSGCSAGLDGLEIKFFKLKCLILFNLSFATCEKPSSWKCARITPLHKGGHRH